MGAIPLLHQECLEREARRRESACPELWDLLDTVKDPEIPVLSIWELGVLQDVQRDGDKITVVITPTYSGCPAMHAMQQDVERALSDAGWSQVEVRQQLSPAWSTRWMTPQARQALAEYGIAPPCTNQNELPQCPQCHSEQVDRISEFGSTACKALYKCRDCLEPFDYFKCL